MGWGVLIILYIDLEIDVGDHDGAIRHSQDYAETMRNRHTTWTWMKMFAFSIYMNK